MRALAYVIALSVMHGVPSSAQQDDSGHPPDPHYTLHAYANLIQIPTLVVTANNSLPPLLTRERFAVSLDAGPAFHPTQMRMEGDDPISLAIVIDDGGSQTPTLSVLGDSLARLTPAYLRPADHFFVYVVDCKIFRTAAGYPALPSLLEDAVQRAMDAPGLHGRKSKPACGQSLQLWDSVNAAAEGLSASPGRRVMVIVSLGENDKSKIPFRPLSEFLGTNSIAVFGLRDSVTFHSLHFTSMGILNNPETPLDILCSENGGFVFDANARNLEATLQKLITLIRGRYILEFPAPDKGDAGIHNLDVKVIGSHTLKIFATGASSIVPDPAISSDPNTIKSKPSPAILGPRKPLPHP